MAGRGGHVLDSGEGRRAGCAAIRLDGAAMDHASHHHPTAAADRLPLQTKLGYGFGGMSYNMMANSIGHLAPFVFNIALGLNPALLGLAIALPRLYDAVTDPVMGAVSDNFKSRWGRRKPFMLAGGIGAGIAFALLWMVPAGWMPISYFWWLLGGSLVFYTFVTVFCVPWTGMGFSLTPDYHERTRLMAVNNFMIAATILTFPWLFALTKLPVFEDGLQGARAVGWGVGVLIILFALLSVWLTGERKQRVEVAADGVEKPGLWAQFRAAASNRAFLILSGSVLMMCIGIFSISTITPYIAIYYIHAGEQAPASVLIGLGGTAWGIASLLFVFPVSKVAQWIGKRRALLCFLGIALTGNLIKWFCYNPAIPWLYVLPPVFIAMGFCALWTLTASMMADVSDYHEFRTGVRNDATLGAVYSWVMKLGVAAAFAISGFILNITGFDQAHGSNQSPAAIFNMRLTDMLVPAIAIAVAMWLVWIFPLRESTSMGIRRRLERRRGKL